MSNNSYGNAILGTQINITGTNAASFASSINLAGLYGITANVSANKVNIICAVPGPFNLTESDIIDTPLANVGIAPGTYGANSNLTILAGSVASPTINVSSHFNIGINWNSVLNSLPKSQRKAFKCIHIAQPERQKTGTPSYRPLNVYDGAVSPVAGHPWTT